MRWLLPLQAGDRLSVAAYLRWPVASSPGECYNAEPGMSTDIDTVFDVS
jgi:hypothetical protein